MAILLVVALHMDVLACGWIGVQVFFVLSGYLITRILFATRHLPFKAYLRHFYIRRALRIFPLYFSYLFVIAFIFLVLVGSRPETNTVLDDVSPLDLHGNAILFRRYAAYLFTYSYNLTHLSPNWSFSFWFGHLWSLCVEEQFYLLWPFAIYFIPRKHIPAFCVVVIAIGPVIRLLVANHVWLELHTLRDVGDCVYWFTGSQIDAFAWGAWVAVSPRWWNTSSRRLLPYCVGLVLSLGIVNLWDMKHAFHDFPISSLGYPLAMISNGEHIWGYSVLNALFALCVAFLVGSGRPHLLEHKYLVAIGRISYGMYLFHWIVLIGVQFAMRAITSSVVVADPWSLSGIVVRLCFLLNRTVALVLIILLASLSYRYFESRFLSLKKKYSRLTA